MAAISLTASSIVSLFLETIFYALYMVLFAGTVWVLVWRVSSETPINKPMLITTVLMFIIATMHIIVDLKRCITAFVHFAARPGGPEPYLNDLHEPLYIFKSALYALQTLIGDAFLLFRVYIIWNRNWKVCIAPVVLLSASIVTGLGMLAYFTRASPMEDVFAPHLRMWIIGFFVPTFLSQILCTSLLAFRIWRIQRDVLDKAVRRDLLPVIVIVLESGAVYALAVLILLIIYAAGSYAEYLILDILPSLIGIIFSLIIVRIGTSSSLKRHSMCSSMRPSSICKLDTVPEMNYPIQLVTSPTNPTANRASSFVGYAPTIPTQAHLFGHSRNSSHSDTTMDRPTNCIRSPPLPPIPLVINISKETCYDYDYDTHVYTPSVERRSGNSADGRSSPSSEANGTYYASSWTGSMASFIEENRQDYYR